MQDNKNISQQKTSPPPPPQIDKSIEDYLKFMNMPDFAFKD